ncbi:hypothetical protein CLAIMM_03889 [Cladophialophora immunda]|nr:hypothetical protein CLAIMM_03889 [Cladophialophora immunda]
MLTSPYTIDIPCVDVNTFIFESGTSASREAPLYFNADAPSQCFSLSQGETYAKQFAKGLQKLGLESNDRVLLYSNNRLFFPVVIWGTIAAECIFTAVSPSASVSEVAFQLRDSGARILIASPDGLDMALDAAQQVGLKSDRVFIFCDLHEDLSGLQNKYSHIQPWTRIWASSDDVQTWSWKKLSSRGDLEAKTAIINYSSGTTGLPKGVEISHYNLVANSAQLLFKRSLVGTTTRAQARKARLDISGERWLAPLPMYHAYGQTYYAINAALLGAKVYIMTKFSLAKYMQYLDIYRITFMTGVPAVIAMLCKQGECVAGKYNLKAIEQVTTGSAPLEPLLGRRLQELYLRPDVQVKQGWGMTETTCSATGFSPDDEDDGRSIGWLNPNCSAKIVTLEEQDFPPLPTGKAVGELWVSGPNIMKGYWENPKATSETIVEDEDGKRWLRTGDIAYADGRGCFYIVDRLKELIKVKGLQVSPAELELFLLNHPDVLEAAVVGAKIDGQEHPRAFIVRKENKVTKEELENLIKENFAPHKWLTAGVYFTDVIPRTASGKIMRRHLPKVTADGLAKL